MSKFYLLPILLIAIYLATLTSAAKPKSKSKEDIFVNTTDSCESIFNETAALVKPMLLIESKKFPTTIAEIDDHCKLGNSFYKKMRKYGKCLDGLAKQTLSIYLHGVRKFVRSICTSTKKKEETIEHLRCADNKTLGAVNFCMNTVNQQLELVAENSTSTQVIGDVCCLYSSVLDCIDNRIGTQVGCSPIADTRKFFRGVLELVLKEVIELICSRYSGLDECKIHNPEGLIRINSVIGSDYKVDGAYLLSPLLKIVGKLSLE